MERTDTAGGEGTGARTETIGLPARPRLPVEPIPHIPDYRLAKVIGRGSFGTVWLAEETLAGVFRAIKILHAARAAKPASAERRDDSHLQREIDGVHAYQAAAKEHPHLVRILKVGLCKVAEAEKPPRVGLVSRPVNPENRSAVSDQRSAKETPASTAGDAGTAADSSFIPHPSSFHIAAYYVMEIADHAGGAQPHLPADYQPLTLATLLRQKGRLSCDEVVRHAMAMLEGIEHLHKSGLQHRDIKSANVLFVGGVLKLADMGLTASGDADETVGTPGYLPPADNVASPPSLPAAAGGRRDGGAGALTGVMPTRASAPPGACGTGLPTGHSGADAAEDRLQGGDGVASAPRGRREHHVRPAGESSPATSPADSPPPAKRFGRPDDRYALGKVMYEMLTGLPAASFPEWPADLDPALDPLLPQLRKLINELCHPRADRRLSDLREARRRLTAFSVSVSMPAISRRRFIASTSAAAGLGLVLGAWGVKKYYDYLDPTQQHFGFWLNDGTDPLLQELACEGVRYTIWRHHRPRGVYQINTAQPSWTSHIVGDPCKGGALNVMESLEEPAEPRLGGTTLRFFDLETNVLERRFEVCGAFQIFNVANPVAGGISDHRGEINQIWLVAGESPADDEMVLLYHGQPGAKPGTKGRFGRRREAGVRLDSTVRSANAPIPIYLALTIASTPEEARRNWGALEDARRHRIRLATICVDAPPAARP